MKPYVVFLRILVVVISVFFIYAAIRSGTSDTPDSRPVPPQTKQIEPQPQAQKQTVARNKPFPQSESTAPKPQQKLLKVIPITPSSGSPDFLSFTILQCRHTGEMISCVGTVKNLAEIPVVLQLGDSRGIDDAARSYVIYLFGNHLTFDTGTSQKLLPSVPVRFFFDILDPYPSVKTVTVDLTVSTGDRYATYYHPVFRDIPVQ